MIKENQLYKHSRLKYYVKIIKIDSTQIFPAVLVQDAYDSINENYIDAFHFENIYEEVTSYYDSKVIRHMFSPNYAEMFKRIVKL